MGSSITSDSLLGAMGFASDMQERNYQAEKNRYADREAWLTTEALRAQAALGQAYLRVGETAEQLLLGESAYEMNPAERAAAVAKQPPEVRDAAMRAAFAQNEEFLLPMLTDLAKKNPALRAAWEKELGVSHRKFEGIVAKDNEDGTRGYGIVIKNEKTGTVGVMDDSPDGVVSKGNPSARHLAFDGYQLLDNARKLAESAVASRGLLGQGAAEMYDRDATALHNQGVDAAKQTAVGLNRTTAAAYDQNLQEATKHITAGAAGLGGTVTVQQAPSQPPVPSQGQAPAQPSVPPQGQAPSQPAVGLNVPVSIPSEPTTPAAIEPRPLSGNVDKSSAVGTTEPTAAPSAGQQAVIDSPLVVDAGRDIRAGLAQAWGVAKDTVGRVAAHMDEREAASLKWKKERYIGAYNETNQIMMPQLDLLARNSYAPDVKAPHLDTPYELSRLGADGKLIDLVMRRRKELGLLDEQSDTTAAKEHERNSGPEYVTSEATPSEQRGVTVGEKLPAVTKAAGAAYQRGEVSFSAVTAAMPKDVVRNKNYSEKAIKQMLDNATELQFEADKKTPLSPRMQFAKGLAIAAGWTGQATAIDAAQKAGSAGLAARATQTDEMLKHSTPNTAPQVDNSVLNTQLNNAAEDRRNAARIAAEDRRAQGNAAKEAEDKYVDNMVGAIKATVGDDEFTAQMQTDTFKLAVRAAGAFYRLGMRPETKQSHAAQIAVTVRDMADDYKRRNKPFWGDAPTIDNIVPMLVKAQFSRANQAEYAEFEKLQRGKPGWKDATDMDIFDAYVNAVELLRDGR